eukprot:5778586-Amphidinium_carterae.1
MRSAERTSARSFAAPKFAANVVASKPSRSCPRPKDHRSLPHITGGLTKMEARHSNRAWRAAVPTKMFHISGNPLHASMMLHVQDIRKNVLQ